MKRRGFIGRLAALAAGLVAAKKLPKVEAATDWTSPTYEMPPPEPVRFGAVYCGSDPGMVPDPHVGDMFTCPGTGQLWIWDGKEWR